MESQTSSFDFLKVLAKVLRVVLGCPRRLWWPPVLLEINRLQAVDVMVIGSITIRSANKSIK
jgi:hypothetical protein